MHPTFESQRRRVDDLQRTMTPKPLAPVPSSAPTTAAAMRRVLVVDDDADLRQLLSTYLSRHSYDVLLLPSTEQLDAYIDRYSPHLIILDLMIPGEDGMAACRRLRGKGDLTPIIMLTARDETIDRIVGLEMGADDYLGKPFEPRELLARLEAVLRRHSASSFEGAAKPFVFGPFECNFTSRQLTRSGVSVSLTGGEFALLSALIRNANRPLKRERLLELTRGGPVDTPRDSLDRAIDMQIYRLRRAIEDDPAHPRHIRTIWGVGYVFVPNADSADATGSGEPPPAA